MDVHGDFICNCQNLETTQMSINRWIEKQFVANASNGLLFQNNKEWTIYMYNDTDESQKLYTEWKLPDKKL